MRVALHACCGPCLLEPYDALASEHDVLVVYANPNIHPPSEFQRRRDTLLAYATSRDIAVDVVPYEPDVWEEAVAGLEGDRAARCRACYRLRVGLAADRASRLGFDAVATTLTVSPYQDHAALSEEAAAACEAAGLLYLDTDFRDRYPEATRRSRDLGMYRQNFCGCRYSFEEAESDRQRRRAERSGR